MKIVIISDIHDNILNLDKVLNYIKQYKINKIICCGDLGSETTLAYLSTHFNGRIWSVLGNMDKDYVEYAKVKDLFVNVELFEHVGKFSIDNKHILIVHEPWRYESYLAGDDVQYVFYGHTHKPWQETKNGKMVLCPGNVANQIYAPTFATWNTENDKFELVQLNTI